MDVLMPQLGETVAEGKITKWFKSPGDKVQPGENLFEIETDKTSMEVPAITGGVLTEIRFRVGEIAKVGAVVAVISNDGTAAASTSSRQASAPATSATSSPSIAAQAEVQEPRAPGPRARGDERWGGIPPVVQPQAPVRLDPYFEVRTPARNYGPARFGGRTVTPLARRLAAERGIDLGSITPSGPHGRIVARDVEAALARGAGAPAGPVLPAGPSAEQVKALYRDVPFTEVPLDNMRATIARRLVEAKQTVPHFYLTIDMDVDYLLKLREEANAGAPKTANGEPAYKLSVNDFVIKALALALQRVPAANAVWAGDRILRFAHSDIGVAVALEGGLITPVIRKVEEKSLSAISNEMRELAERARARKLKPHEYQGGATTVSNLGMYGVREFSAIINPPQATILAVGAAQRRPAEAADGSVRFTSQMTATLACDHRVVDGALGAELLAAFKQLIESPVRMLV
ncbi:MAG TPA: dihydrolipoamide acetyltransferase family protein [Xanthobacteraceae bacterium]|nr:dihydrolipoamide acetyltransferase family protein [Xanthobacteraceae bacterium]